MASRQRILKKSKNTEAIDVSGFPSSRIGKPQSRAQETNTSE